MNGISVPVDQLKPLLLNGTIKPRLVVECTFDSQPGTVFFMALDIPAFVEHLKRRNIEAAVIHKESPYLYLLEDLQ